MKLPWLSRFKVSEEEKAESHKALEESHQELEIANNVKSDAQVVGESQRRLRAENHFGQKLAHIYRNAT
jgi:hypothetical protein